jgi:hypothetical protein
VSSHLPAIAPLYPTILTELRERMAVRATAACCGVERAPGIVWLEPMVTLEVQDNEMMQGRPRDAVLRGVHLGRRHASK